MRHNSLAILYLVAASLNPTLASDLPSIPFVDGLWRGDIDREPGSSDFRECRASTRFADGTTLTLAITADGRWRMDLSNPFWRLPPSHRYAVVSLVDFYPRLQFDAEARTVTRLEIADIGRISLLEQIENGHTIDLDADGFSAKYDLEGSAKVIERLRNCFAEHTAGK